MPKTIVKLIHTLYCNGFKGYLVGGAVRDYFLGIEPHDFDIATDATPDELLNLFSGRAKLLSSKHGTVLVYCDENMHAELATFRREIYTTESHRSPSVVEFVKDIETDLARRDFSCNAIAYNLMTKRFVDPYGGIKDTKKRCLCTIGYPHKTLGEDYVRILRGLSLCANLGFTAEPLTHYAMNDIAQISRGFVEIGGQRMARELKKILKGEHITDTLLTYREVFVEIFPCLKPTLAFVQHSTHHDFTVYEHSARAVGLVRPNATLRLCMLLHDIGKPGVYRFADGHGHFKAHAQRGEEIVAKELCERIELAKKDMAKIIKFIHYHRYVPRTIEEWSGLHRRFTYEEWEEFVEILTADALSKKVDTSEGEAIVERFRQLQREEHR